MSISLPLPNPLTLSPTTLDALIEQWTTSSGEWPICFGVDTQANALRDYLLDLPPGPIERTIAASDGIYQRMRSGMRYDEACDDAFFDEDDASSHTIPLLEHTPAPTDTPRVIDATQLGNAHHLWSPERTFYASSITDVAPWQVIALLELGGINHHPMANEHAALLHYWHVRFGATLIAVTLDSVTLSVTTPPTSWKDAFELAQDHVDYCPELIQGTGENIKTLATTLRQSTLWHFAWNLDEPMVPGDDSTFLL